MRLALTYLRGQVSAILTVCHHAHKRKDGVRGEDEVSTPMRRLHTMHAA